MQYITNNLNLLFIVAVVGFSVVSWVVRKLQEQSAIRRQQQLRERMRLEALRTGRIPTEADPAPTPEQRLAELAARRAEMIRRGTPPPVQTRANAPRPPQVPQRSVPARQVPTGPRPSGQRPVPQARVPQPPRPPAQRPVQRPGPRPVPRAPSPNQPLSPAQRRQEMIEARRRAAEAKARSQSKPKRAPAPRPQPKHDAPLQVTPIAEIDPFAAGKAKIRISRSKLREAIVLREILDAPIALRREENEL